MAHNVGKDPAVSGYGELCMAHDPCKSTQCTPSGFTTAELTPSGFSSTHYPLDNSVSHHGKPSMACDDHDITQHTPSGFTTTQLTPSGLAATCYPTWDAIHEATTSRGCSKGIWDSSHRSSSTQQTPGYTSTCYPNWDNDATTSSGSLIQISTQDSSSIGGKHPNAQSSYAVIAYRLSQESCKTL